ncbi:MAG: hypothetical protein WBF01_19495, partial [Candidatus Acidiferrum sp.]
AFLLVWPGNRRKWQLGTFLLLTGFLGAMWGCSGSKNVSTAPSGPSATSFVVTVTATGGAGAHAVTHSVTLQVTVQ